MPSVLIEVRKQYTREQEAGLIEAVHAALVNAFKIKPGDRNVRLVVHEPHRFACPPCEQPDAYTFVGVSSGGTPVWLLNEVASAEATITIGQRDRRRCSNSDPVEGGAMRGSVVDLPQR